VFASGLGKSAHTVIAAPPGGNPVRERVHTVPDTCLSPSARERRPRQPANERPVGQSRLAGTLCNGAVKLAASPQLLGTVTEPFAA